MKKSKILAMLLALAMVLTCIPMMAFADDGISYTNISVGTRKDITFTDEGDSPLFKLNVPESGLYRLYLYQDYGNNYNKYFYVGLNKSPDFSEASIDDLYWGNSETSEPDYHVYKLDAGTYYLEAQCFDFAGGKSQLGFEFQKTDGWELSYDSIGYVDQWLWIGANNVDTQEEAKIDRMDSSDPTIVSIRTNTWEEDGVVEKYFDIKAKKVGTVIVSVDFTAPDGTKGHGEATVRIKKYPNPIKSLKVNGKKVNVSKNKYDYNKGNYKSTKASVKVVLKKGWKIKYPRAYVYTKSGKEVPIKMTKKMLTNGTAVKFLKKYESINIGFAIVKGDTWIDYNVNLYR